MHSIYLDAMTASQTCPYHLYPPSPSNRICVHGAYLRNQALYGMNLRAMHALHMQTSLFCNKAARTAVQQVTHFCPSTQYRKWSKSKWWQQYLVDTPSGCGCNNLLFGRLASHALRLRRSEAREGCFILAFLPLMVLSTTLTRQSNLEASGGCRTESGN